MIIIKAGLGLCAFMIAAYLIVAGLHAVFS